MHANTLSMEIIKFRPLSLSVKSLSMEEEFRVILWSREPSTGEVRDDT